MEAASKKRGRPKVIPEDLRAVLASAPGGQTDRSKQDTYYRFSMMSVLEEASDCEWLLPSEDEPYKWKPGIVAELGRTMMAYGDAVAIEAARQICAIKPSVKRAIALIRKARTGKGAAVSVDGIEKAIVNAMELYRSTHPGTTPDQLLEALTGAYRIVESIIEEPK